MQFYASDYNDKYPAADKWCDLLIRHSKVEEKMFVCPYAEKGRCHFAINPNCKKNSPNDIVLLFETKGGWNQVGGTEILTFENHNGKGCSVLFNDGRVEFVKKEDFGELKWATEKKGSESIE
jgi:prepilin-type processing-associated H-X9-DG protein